jgi:hypothetical protein
VRIPSLVTKLFSAKADAQGQWHKCLYPSEWRTVVPEVFEKSGYLMSDGIWNGWLRVPRTIDDLTAFMNTVCRLEQETLAQWSQACAERELVFSDYDLEPIAKPGKIKKLVQKFAALLTRNKPVSNYTLPVVTESQDAYNLRRHWGEVVVVFGANGMVKVADIVSPYIVHQENHWSNFKVPTIWTEKYPEMFSDCDKSTSSGAYTECSIRGVEHVNDASTKKVQEVIELVKKLDILHALVNTKWALQNANTKDKIRDLQEPESLLREDMLGADSNE